MSSPVYLLSKEIKLTNILRTEFIREGLNVVVARNSNKISKDCGYLVVININGEFNKDRRLADTLTTQGVKAVIVYGVMTKEIDVEAPVKHVFVDQIIPDYSKMLKAVKKEALKAQVFIPKEAWVAVLTSDGLVELIKRELFSFREKKKILAGKLISFSELVKIYNPFASVSINGNLTKRIPRRDLRLVEYPLKIEELMVVDVGIDEKKKLRQFGIISKFKRTRALKVVKYLPLFLVALFITPYVMMAAGAGGTYLAYRSLLSGNIDSAKVAVEASKTLSRVSGEIISSSGFMPLKKEARLLWIGSDISQRVLAISDSSKQVDRESLGKVNLELASLYRDLSFLEGELRGKNLPYKRFLPEIDNLSVFRDYVLTASRLSKHLPNLLGFEGQKTYMVLLQNNMELRPTGGFIGSFAIINMLDGEILDNTIYDVYSSDGQLKGYIKPPDPIVNHLGEASWTLRDSNWDPDFPTSANRAQWFLDKSIDRKVDGVIAINLEAAREFLKIVEPLYLPDFGDRIDSRNMYEKVQHEVENNFFAGSRKKAQYLSALSQSLINRLVSASKAEYPDLFSALVRKLASRDIQVYLNDTDVQQIFSDKRWDGAIYKPACSVENCDSIVSGIVEANLGVNKSNYYIKREIYQKYEMEENRVVSETSVKIKNTAATRDRVPEERYKVYIRAFGNKSSSLVGIYETSGAGRVSMKGDIENFNDRVEYGVLVDVLPGEEKIVTFKIRNETNLDFSKSGELSILWWKQSGSREYPITVEFSAPELKNFTFNPPYVLTEGGRYRYNTTLYGDLSSVINWNK